MTEPEMSRVKKTGYDPHGIEEHWAKVWEAAGSSHVDECSPKPPYAIVIPPPNITGFLHIGHAMNNTLQDILIRWRRMQGYNALWIPGTDHAGIATQNVVERQLQEEGRRREDLGRTGFVERVWRWKAESGGTIIRQLKRLGASCDWERECFTMDEDRQQAVREVFVRLYDEGLIYRGERLINWCPRCQTALSDIEVEYEDTQGALYHIRYPLADDPGAALIVATTRPETMLGDTAVAVHPDDPRYNRLIGRQVRLPLTGRTILVVGDAILVDREFGTGAVKITPAHDFNDFEAGERHGLPRIALFAREGTIRIAVQSEAQIDLALFKEIQRQPVAVAREKVLDRLRQEGLLEKVEPHLHALGKCYRCRSVVEPFLSTQWFVKVKPLAEPAIRAVEEGRTRFVPEHWENTYFAWMRNIKDWCISRQLWWGHQIPAWYCGKCDKDNILRGSTGVGSEVFVLSPEAQPIVSAQRPASCPRCGHQELVQDPDVLDTWFSSALWPFSTMGWPKQTELLRRFYPTSTLVTSFDIIFFWVARMMMMGLKFRGDVPFREVYIHALVRDAEGQKMSKSKGNVIDPIEIIDKYGADAFRFTLAALAAQGRDIRLSEERIEGYRHFCNKLWNANQFLARHLPLLEGPLPPVSSLSLDLADRWLLSRLHELIGSVTKALEEYRFNEAASALYQFVWHEYCDWYLEIVKSRLASGSSQNQQQACGEPCRTTGVALLLLGLETALRLLHPFMPFITEEIWQQLSHHGTSLMVAEWPKADPGWQAADAEASMDLLMDLTRATRDLRSDLEIPPQKSVRLVLRTSSDNDDRTIDTVMPYLAALTRAEHVSSGQHLDRPSRAAVALVGGIEVHLPVDDLSVFIARQQKLRRELEKVEQELARVDKKLGNPDFLSKAPEAVVTKERGEQARLMDTRTKLLQHLERIEHLLK